MTGNVRKLSIVLLTAAFVAAALAMNFSKLIWQISRYRRPRAQDEVTSIQQRFEPVSRVLPPCKVVGYLTDVDSSSEATLTVARKEFAQIRYAVSPVLLVWGTGPDLVLGNLRKDSGRSDMIKKHRLAVEKDLGRGVLILKRRR